MRTGKVEAESWQNLATPAQPQFIQTPSNEARPYRTYADLAQTDHVKGNVAIKLQGVRITSQPWIFGQNNYGFEWENFGQPSRTILG